MKKTKLSAGERTALLGTQSIGRLLVRLSGPAITGMVIQSMYNLVDTVFVGKGVGTLALAALAVCFPIQMLLLAVGKTVGIGAASIISRRLGAGRDEEAGTFTDELIDLRSWLVENECPIIAMESTGVYWRPVHNILEG